MTKDFLEILKKELLSLAKSTQLLTGSYEKCRNIGEKSDYSASELEAFEALTARFSRLSDLLLQKIFRLIDALELVDEGTILDRINRAEKRGIVISAQQYKKLRLLRNTIVHEYESDEIGINLMYKARYNPEAAVKFWQKMSKLGKSSMPEFLSTHPASSNRVSKMRKLIPSLTKK